eukprot:scaffold2728_cov110-Cylindrotheca_fusiformis.AAC.2
MAYFFNASIESSKSRVPSQHKQKADDTYDKDMMLKISSVSAVVDNSKLKFDVVRLVPTTEKTNVRNDSSSTIMSDRL